MSSVDSVKKANQLEKGRAELAGKDLNVREKLNVHVQINTSGEESKSGVEPKDAAELCKHIREACPHLRLSGVMTIGAIARSQATNAENENEDFKSLREVRDKLTQELSLDNLELSMGMSGDFEGAITMGSDEVRIGSTIFGQRPAKKDATVVEDAEQGVK